MDECPRCQKRGKNWKGDDPRCAFKSGFFSEDNWNCATMNKLRACDGFQTFSEDNSCMVLPFEGNFIVLKWYKSRGRIDFAVILNDSGMIPISLDSVEEYFFKK